MLVCSVSMRAPRRAIPADVAEAAAALDATTTGFVVFATLVDDPASVADHVDAYLGEIMVEAASASDSITAGGAYTDGVVEAASAGSVQDGAIAAAGAARIISASRAGGSVVVSEGGGKTHIISNVGAVT